MDRSIAGTRADGFGVEEEDELLVSHRAGGMAAPHAPTSSGAGSLPTSFVTVVWTSGVTREVFTDLYRTSLQASFLARPPSQTEARAGKGKCKGKGQRKGKDKGTEEDLCGQEAHIWPLDPDLIRNSISHDTLLPWTPELTLFDRQKPRPSTHTHALT
jgi:hypothetical protein